MIRSTADSYYWRTVISLARKVGTNAQNSQLTKNSNPSRRLSAETVVDYITGNDVPATPEEIGVVQPMARRLVEDISYSKAQIKTHPQHRIKQRPGDVSGSYPLDIAVFEDDECRKLRMLVECKRPDATSGRAQLETYMALSGAPLGVWVNGDETTMVVLQRVAKSNHYDFRELLKIPAPDRLRGV